MAAVPPDGPSSVVTGDLPSPPPFVTAAEPERLAVDSLFRFDAALRSGITENLTARRAAADAIADRVDRAFADFRPSSLSAEELERGHYLERGNDVGETLDKAVEEGVQALRSSDAAHAITFRDRADLLDSIATPSSRSAASGDVVELGALLSFMKRKSRGSSLVRATTSSPHAAELEAERIVADIENAVQPGDAAGARATSSAARDADQLVTDAVKAQMRSATSPESKLEYGSMPAIPSTAGDDQTQKRILETFQLRPGASDVTSYHDFNVLQIAFPHVWTRIFDGELQSMGRELYREYVKLKEFSGAASDDMPVTSLDDLRRLIEEIRKLSQVVEQDIPVDLRSPGDDPRTAPKGSDDLGHDVRVGVAVATGGASELLQWAIEQFSKIGQKPIITWEQFPGPWGGRSDTIDVSIEDGVVPPSVVEIALKTDPQSHVKVIEFEPYDPARKTFVHGPSVGNWGHVSPVTLYLEPTVMAAGVLEFGSEESPGNNLGRYVLADLSRKLKAGSRVTFHWKDS